MLIHVWDGCVCTCDFVGIRHMLRSALGPVSGPGGSWRLPALTRTLQEEPSRARSSLAGASRDADLPGSGSN